MHVFFVYSPAYLFWAGEFFHHIYGSIGVDVEIEVQKITTEKQNVSHDIKSSEDQQSPQSSHYACEKTIESYFKRYITTF